MKNNCNDIAALSPADIVRKLFLSWLVSVTLVYTLTPGALADIATINAISFSSVIILTFTLFATTIFLCRFISPLIERWLIVLSFSWLSICTLITSFTPAFLCVCCFIDIILVIYAIKGWDSTPVSVRSLSSENPFWKWLTGILAVLFFIFVSIWTVCRVVSFCTPTYDFGIFSQMFYSMKTTGLPMTTLERDGLLSHFNVHVSPIYYLLLPFYCQVPRPETLQVLQAATLSSAVVPLWLLGKRHNIPVVLRTILCALLLLYPAYAGGTSYDIHENAFLTPLILWLFYALDCRNNILSYVFTFLVLMVKEDAAVYCAVISLFVIARSLLSKENRRQLLTGSVMLIISLVWFLAVTWYLSSVGDGVMTYRYSNFMYGESTSLLSVVKTVILCPMKAIFECLDTEKLKFIGLTLLPLLGTPFLTRKYERFILLIPYILVNLMSDYQYQHDIFFQYTYGATACLFYVTAVNIADFKLSLTKHGVLLAALVTSAACFISVVVPKATPYPRYYKENRLHYTQIRNVLDIIPADASVCATTFYTTYLSQRDVVYDVRYATTEHLLDCEYVVLTTTNESCYKSYAESGENGLLNLTSLLERNGYSLVAQLEGTLVIYNKT